MNIEMCKNERLIIGGVQKYFCCWRTLEIIMKMIGMKKEFVNSITAIIL
jgi:hypothetical protein